MKKIIEEYLKKNGYDGLREERMYKFKKIKAWREKFGKCPECGRKVTRRATFENTVNPYNRNKKGQVKSESEVCVDVNKEADRWIPNFTHYKCKRRKVKKIIEEYLKKNGYDGLREESGECGCEIGDLAPCEEMCLDCEPGYKVIPPPNVKAESDYYICARKDDKPWEDWEVDDEL